MNKFIYNLILIKNFDVGRRKSDASEADQQSRMEAKQNNVRHREMGLYECVVLTIFFVNEGLLKVG